MPGRSYAVVWREGNGRTRAGKLELGPSGLVLEGAAPRGRPSKKEIACAELTAVRIGRSAQDRLDGRPTLVLERRAGRPLRISTLDGPGAVHELVERLAHVCSAPTGQPRRRAASDSAGERLRVLIAGGGVAALEAMLALRALAEERVEIELLTPEREFSYRPLAVAEPFGLGEVRRFPLADVVCDCSARHRLDALAAVDAEQRLGRTRRGLRVGYDALVLATGARMRKVLRGALTFCGSSDSGAVRELLDDLAAGRTKRVVFAIPGGVVWALPLYELALLTAASLSEREVKGVKLALVTPETEPLGLFGRRASEAIRKLLDERGIELCTDAYPAAVGNGRLSLVPAGHIAADRVVALPRLEGPRFPGLPHDEGGFIPTDSHGRVQGLADVYAAGDITAFPVKQGGVAAQQADAVAEMLAARAGAAVTPTPFRPVLRGLVLTGASPSFLRADLGGGRGETSTAATDALWWPPSKIAGRYLSPYLAARAGLAVM